MARLVLDDKDVKDIELAVKEASDYIKGGHGKQYFLGLHPNGTIQAFVNRKAVKEFDALLLGMFCKSEDEVTLAFVTECILANPHTAVYNAVLQARLSL